VRAEHAAVVCVGSGVAARMGGGARRWRCRGCAGCGGRRGLGWSGDRCGRRQRRQARARVRCGAGGGSDSGRGLGRGVRCRRRQRQQARARAEWRRSPALAGEGDGVRARRRARRSTDRAKLARSRPPARRGLEPESSRFELKTKRNQSKTHLINQKFIEMPTNREKSPKNSSKSKNL
jgi:hypothetical protein